MVAQRNLKSTIIWPPEMLYKPSLPSREATKDPKNLHLNPLWTDYLTLLIMTSAEEPLAGISLRPNMAHSLFFM